MRYFVAVAEELHFGRAAARLHIAQPPLSQQIKKLEEELGATLLARTKRKVELTPAGRLFLEEARLTLSQAERAKRIAGEAQAGARGRLRVGFVTSASYSVLPILVRRFRREFPLIDLELLEMTPSQQLAALDDGSVDVGILRPPVSNTCLVSETILEEPIVAALPFDHRKASQKAVSLASLAEDAFVLFPRRHGPGIHDVLMKACHDAGFVPNVSYSPNEMQTILAYVAAGLGVSLVPQSLSGFHQGSIAYLPLRGNSVRVGLALLSRAGKDDAPLREFRRVSTEVGMEYTSRYRKTLGRKEG